MDQFNYNELGDLYLGKTLIYNSFSMNNGEFNIDRRVLDLVIKDKPEPEFSHLQIEEINGDIIASLNNGKGYFDGYKSVKIDVDKNIAIKYLDYAQEFYDGLIRNRVNESQGRLVK